MSYTPQVGHKVKGIIWPDDAWIDVLFVGNQIMVGVNSHGDEITRGIDGDWEHVIERPELPDLPDQWAVVYPNGIVGNPIHQTLSYAMRYHSSKTIPMAYIRYAPIETVWPDEVPT